MDKKLRKKLKKFLKQQKGKFLCFHVDETYVMNTLHPKYYYDFLRVLDDDELMKVISIFSMYGKSERLFAEIPANFWLTRVSENVDIWGSLPKEKWQIILNSELVVTSKLIRLFTAHGISREMQATILKNDYFVYAGIEECINFFEWLYREDALEVDEAPEIMAKIARLSICSLARLFEEGSATLVQRILKERDLNYEEKVEICQEIKTEELYDVLEKAEFSFLTTLPNKKLLSLVYERLPLEDKKKFFEKMDENGLLDYLKPEVIADYFGYLSEEVKEDFIKKLFFRENSVFENLCQELSNGKIFEFYEALLADRDGKTRSAIKLYLEKKTSLNFAEEAILSFVTRQ